MRHLLLAPFFLLIFGCAQNHFNVPVENYAERVRVLGVAPIMIDESSDILYPQREELISLVERANRANEYRFVHKLRETGNYYGVSLLDGDPQSVFSSLMARREKRDDSSTQYNKYFWNIDTLSEYIRKNNLDAVMLIVVSGLTKSDKIYSDAWLSYLTSDYNYLIMTAYILDKNGAVLWEYPNFRGRSPKYSPMVALQYPDFNEAEANMSDQVMIKFRTLEGIKRALEENDKDMLRRKTQDSKVYAEQFDTMISLLKFTLPKDNATLASPAQENSPNNEPYPTATSPENVGSPSFAEPEPIPSPMPQEEPYVSTPDSNNPSEGAYDQIVPAPGT